ncbi:hypothetical protein ACKVV1_004089 [Pyricularia oryzae]
MAAGKPPATTSLRRPPRRLGYKKLSFIESAWPVGSRPQLRRAPRGSQSSSAPDAPGPVPVSPNVHISKPPGWIQDHRAPSDQRALETALVKHLALQGYGTDNMVKKRPLRISIIDNYQGDDIFIASLTRSSFQGDIGFMAAQERFNVLISRTRTAAD